MTREVRSYRKTYLLIDALDECTERNSTRQDFLSHLQVREAQWNLTILVTSRPHIRDVPNIFENIGQLEIRPMDKDLRLYIERRIQREPRLKRNVQNDRALKGIIVDTIMAKAQGMYVIFVIYCSYIGSYLPGSMSKCSLESTIPETSKEP
jgi:hypothetical protein